jgi:CheY-like chemotaxis protein/HPt (histidine-containing phosphotransfer) domain-containing protein
LMAEFGPLRILVAEDNVVNQRLAVRLIEKQGHTAVVASNGRQAIAAVEEDRFDAVLMDVQMPEVNGLEATAAIREMEASNGRRTPIIALTAHAIKGDRERCLAAGMDDYVSKPIRAGELFRVLQRVVGRARKREPEELDRAAILADFGGDAELVHVVAGLFLEDYPKRLAEIADAIQEANGAKLERAAHTLKGAATNFRAFGAVEAALRLEKIGSESRFDEAREALADLERELARLASELASLRTEEAV